MKLGANSGARSTGSKQRGIDYHRRVYRHLTDHFGQLSDRQKAAAASGQFVATELLIEPWYKRLGQRPTYRQPDAVILFPELRTGIVVEVKLNWKDGRDAKLIDEYLGIVRSAEGLEVVWPLLVTRCLRGYQHPPLKGLNEIEKCQSWFQGDPTPLMLLI